MSIIIILYQYTDKESTISHLKNQLIILQDFTYCKRNTIHTAKKENNNIKTKLKITFKHYTSLKF